PHGGERGDAAATLRRRAAHLWDRVGEQRGQLVRVRRQRRGGLGGGGGVGGAAPATLRGRDAHLWDRVGEQRGQLVRVRRQRRCGLGAASGIGVLVCRATEEAFGWHACRESGRPERPHSL